MQKFYVTNKSLQKLQEEFNFLTKVKKKEMIESLKHAVDLGDLRENAEWDATTDDFSELEDKIYKLEKIIQNAIVYEEKKSQTVVLGSTVTLSFDDEETEIYKIVGSAEIHLYENCISDASVLALQILGKKVNSLVKVNTQNGIYEVKIIDIK